jgi:putative transposase
MPRLARLFVPGCPVHIIQRGHNKQAIFVDDHDRLRFLDWTWEAAQTHGIAVHAWVLMTNHVHFAISAPDPERMAKFGQFFSQRYSQYFNHRYKRIGTLWQGRFKSAVVVSDHYLLRLYRYIELNPVRAGLVSGPEEFRWSSYAHHAGLSAIDPNIVDHQLYWSLGNTPFDRQANYRSFCQELVSPEEIAKVTQATLSGWAIQTSDAPTTRLDASRPLRPSSRGRPSIK